MYFYTQTQMPVHVLSDIYKYNVTQQLARKIKKFVHEYVFGNSSTLFFVAQLCFTNTCFNKLSLFLQRWQ